jgi:hypothetical protein
MDTVNAREPGYKSLEEMTVKEILNDLEQEFWRERNYSAARRIQVCKQKLLKEEEPETAF